MEISVLILSCVILGLNPVLPVLLYFIFLISRFVTLYGFYQIKYIHTYIVVCLARIFFKGPLISPVRLFKITHFGGYG